MIREIADSNLCEHVCDTEKKRERDSSPFQTQLHKMCVNVNHFWGKLICNIDSSPPGAELKWQILASGLFPGVRSGVKAGERHRSLPTVHQHDLSYQKSCLGNTT